ncbi:hypothetical protein JHV675_41240 [Mycobacterium avium subsp. hominissuis]
MNSWSAAFARGRTVGQVLLSAHDISMRAQHTNAQRTLDRLRAVRIASRWAVTCSHRVLWFRALHRRRCGAAERKAARRQRRTGDDAERGTTERGENT